MVEEKNSGEVLWREDAVADRLGLARDAVRELRRRNLSSPEHYRRHENALCYTRHGWDRIVELVAAQLPRDPAASERLAAVMTPPEQKIVAEEPRRAEDVAPAELPAGLVEVRVTRVFRTDMRRQQRLLGEGPKRERLVIVVRDASRCFVGQVLRCHVRGGLAYARGRLSSNRRYQ